MHIYTTGVIQTFQAFIMYTTWITMYMAYPPCFFPLLAAPFVPLSDHFYLLGTLLAVTGSVHLGLRLLVN